MDTKQVKKEEMKMLILKMSSNKNLTITKSGNTYQDENNAEIIKIILSKTINGIDLKDCYIYLSFINQQGLGNVSDIKEYLKYYSEDYYMIEIPMYQMFTHEPGTIEMWIKILHSPTEMVAKTNEIKYNIKTHKEIEGTIPEQEMSIIDGLVMKLDSTAIKVDDISGKVEGIDDYVNELQQGKVLLVQPENDETIK